jgi:hypothetical protein
MRIDSPLENEQARVRLGLLETIASDCSCSSLACLISCARRFGEEAEEIVGGRRKEAGAQGSWGGCCWSWRE